MAVLMFLNMTVAVETINGLIFYSNIVGIGGDAFPLANFVSGLTSLFNLHAHNKILFLCRNGHVLENMASVGILHILDSSCYFHNSLKSTLHEILLIDCQEKSRRNTGYSNPTLIHYTFLRNAFLILSFADLHLFILMAPIEGYGYQMLP